jgi:hypothetical protein
MMRSTYYAVGIQKLITLMKQAGFEDVRRLDERFFQPVITGTRKAQPEGPGYGSQARRT